MAQAISNKSLTAQVHYQSQARPCGTCSGQSGSGTDLSLSIQFPLLISFHKFPIPSHPSLTINHTHTHTHKSKGNRSDRWVSTNQNMKRQTLLLTGSGFTSSLPMTSPTPGAPGASSSLLRCSTHSASLCGEGSTCNCPEGFKPSYSAGSWLSNCDAGLSYGNATKHCLSIAHTKCNKTLSQYSAHWTQAAKTRMSTFIWSKNCLQSQCMSHNIRTISLGSRTIFKVRYNSKYTFHHATMWAKQQLSAVHKVQLDGC